MWCAPYTCVQITFWLEVCLSFLATACNGISYRCLMCSMANWDICGTRWPVVGFNSLNFFFLNDGCPQHTCSNFRVFMCNLFSLSTSVAHLLLNVLKYQRIIACCLLVGKYYDFSCLDTLPVKLSAVVAGGLVKTWESFSRSVHWFFCLLHTQVTHPQFTSWFGHVFMSTGVLRSGCGVCCYNVPCNCVDARLLNCQTQRSDAEGCKTYCQHYSGFHQPYSHLNFK